MKRSVLFAVLFLILFILASCSTKQEFSVLEVGGYNYDSGANHVSEIDLFFTTEKEIKLVTNRDFNINGRIFSLPYHSSQENYHYHSALELYEKVENGEHITVGVNKDTGRIDRYFWCDQKYLDSVQSEKISRDECLSIAMKYLASYIDDLSAYQLTDENYREIPEFEAEYDFTFSRVIDGVITSDSARVRVTIYGTVVSHVFTSLGEMKDSTLPTEAEIATIRKNVEAKIDEIYAPLKDEYNITYEINETTFVKLNDGRHALEYILSVTMNSLSGDKPTYTEQTHLLVYTD